MDAFLFGENMTESLQERFGAPPFSILDARQGYWQKRKKQWTMLGIHGEQGRDYLGTGEGGGQLLNASCQPPEVYRKKKLYEDDLGRKASWDEFYQAHPTIRRLPTTSVFDPVLCELMYRWFCPYEGSILDPFAGEATKGIVATYTGHSYVGIELREDQVAINRRQAHSIGVSPTWLCGDSARLDSLLPNDFQADMVFTSPPYYDLEVYSARNEDGSALPSYDEFMAWYRDIFQQAVRHLKQNRFLVVKVGEIRNKRTGEYRNFVGDNITLFKDLGLTFYNQAILITSYGSLPIRAGIPFTHRRKLAHAHQNILVFYHGNPKTIPQEFSIDLGRAVNLPE